MPEHVKNYRPKILVFTGVPVHRQPLVDFANLITKKLSLLICAHVEENSQFGYVETLKENVGHWLKDHNIKAFFNVVPSSDFEKGAVSINEGQVVEVNAQSNLKIKDLTGAGDLSAAGYLHGVINQLNVKECLIKGTELSSKIIQKIGARI